MARILCAAAIALLACSEPTVPNGLGGVTLRVLTAAGTSVSLDSGRVLVRGPDSRNASAVPGQEVRIPGLTPGTYAVALEGFLGGAVERFVNVTGIHVAAGADTRVTIPSFPSFRPDSLVFSDSVSVGLTVGLTIPSLAGAMAYHVEWSNDPSFASYDSLVSPISGGIFFQVPSFDVYYFRVRGVDLFGTLGAPGPARRIHILLCNNCWTTKASMPTPRADLGADAINGVFYAVGGFDDSGALATVEAYDPATNTWTQKAPMPTRRFGLGVGVINGVLYAVGGFDGNVSLRTVEAYDPGTDTWTTRTSLSTPRSELGVAVLNGRLYAVGGFSDSGKVVGSVEAYDPVSNTWSARTSMSTTRARFGIGVVGGLLYAIGGFGGEMEAYDPGTNAWSTRAPMPTVRDDFRTGVVSDNLYAIGGCCGTYPSSLSTVEAFNSTTNSWTPKASLQTARSVTGTGVINGIVYVVGGFNAGSVFGTLEAYQP